jgi:hypothetical protein
MTVVGKKPYITLDGNGELPAARTSAIILGDHKVSRPIFIESKHNLLSVYFLSRFRVVMDFPNSTHYLIEGKSFSKSDVLPAGR